MMESGDYFVINLPRQHGKAAMLFRMLATLQQDDNYLPILMNFQGISNSLYASSDTLSQFFYKELRKEIAIPENGFPNEKLEALQAVHTLDELLELWCKDMSGVMLVLPSGASIRYYLKLQLF